MKTIYKSAVALSLALGISVTLSGNSSACDNDASFILGNDGNDYITGVYAVRSVEPNDGKDNLVEKGFAIKPGAEVSYTPDDMPNKDPQSCYYHLAFQFADGKIIKEERVDLCNAYRVSVTKEGIDTQAR